jgi:hypothetical protein
MTAIGPQEQPLPKGEYKILPNHVRTRKGTDHSYAPVDVTPPEMARLVSELRCDSFLAAHPVVQAAYAHYCLVVVHPFADGNGRVARALASAFTYRAISMPVVILSEQKEAYLTALERADEGDYQDFVDFMFARCLDTMGLVEESLLSASTPAAESSVAAIQDLYMTKGGFTHEEVDQLGIRLIEAFQGTVTQTLGKIQAPKVKSQITIGGGSYSAPAQYRPPFSGNLVCTVTLTTAPPVNASVQRFYALMMPRDAVGNDKIQLVNSQNPNDVFIARIDQLIPSLSGVVQIRLNMFVERLLNELFAQLSASAQLVTRSQL